MTSLEIDEELRTAAVNGDVEFLQQCVASGKHANYYSTYFPWEEEQSGSFHYGNIFHISARENREDFIREVLRILPVKDTQRLLIQPRYETNKWNPLHSAAYTGNVEIVKMFLDVYTCSSSSSIPSDPSQRPWLMKDSIGFTPCRLAHCNNHEECAVQILKMDKGVLCNMIYEGRGSNIIYEAMLNKMSNLALEILRSPHPIGCAGGEGFTPFHHMSNFEYSVEAKEMCQRLLEREPDLINKTNRYEVSAFHSWAYHGVLWPFKCLLESKNILPDVKRVFVNFIAHKDIYGHNCLHALAKYTSNEEDAIEIAKLLIGIYKEETSTQLLKDLPWLVQTNYEETPLSLAITRGFERFAMYILTADENAITQCPENVLFLAIRKGCHTVAEKILEVIDDNKWTQLLTDDQQNVLHLAPLCTDALCMRLIEGNPQLLKGVGKGGTTILHSWLRDCGKVWLFEYMLKSQWKNTFVKLIVIRDYNDQNNPFHVAAMATPHKETNQIVQLLVDAYKEVFTNWSVNKLVSLPWFAKNKKGEGPLHLAIQNQHEELAIKILSLYQKDHINELLDFYEPKHSILFLAIKSTCPKVAERIMARLDKESWEIYLKDPSNGQNILHLATDLKDAEFGKWLVGEAPKEFITEKDKSEEQVSPWDKAYEIGHAWFIEAVLKKDPTVFQREPLAWTTACQNGHVSALRAYINHDPGEFRNICIKKKNSPLHHIKLPNLTEYEKFMKISHMKDLINLQNSQGETPLHIAIQKRDIFLTETLLNMKKIIYDITDKKSVTAMDLLAHIYNKDDDDWTHMCIRNGIDPTIKTAYFQHKTNLLDVRTSLFVVAALLATITFTAGFTLPGGFDQETGTAVLGKKPAFIVFFISDTLALFFSMLVLIFLTWSMVPNYRESLILIDRSMILLRVALNCTLLAFMTGVYIVIAPKSLWVAIFIMVIISFLIVISFDKTFLLYMFQTLEKLFPAANKERTDEELGFITKEEQQSLLSESRQSSNQSSRSSNQTSHETSDDDDDDSEEEEVEENKEEEKDEEELGFIKKKEQQSLLSESRQSSNKSSRSSNQASHETSDDDDDDDGEEEEVEENEEEEEDEEELDKANNEEDQLLSNHEKSSNEDLEAAKSQKNDDLDEKK